eukprot:TRINITY_DN8271_c0_g2_i2.p1 TRINITY_DN8271_c0_g2~~TRINITY_DN8271_c0_g2_i2.p1  ORF type:complete len:220 (+),score=26.56 TRINITY_DN8271_c0_g2_i2:218-877(+)
MTVEKELIVQYGNKVQSANLTLYLCGKLSLRGFMRGFLIGVAIKGSTYFAVSVFTKKRSLYKRPKELINYIFGSRTIKFGLFLGSLVGTYRGIHALLCLIRKKDDSINSFIAGGIAGLSILLDDDTKRVELSLYLLARVLSSLWNFFVHKHYLPSIPFGSALLFALLCTIIMYTYIHEPELMRKDYYQFIDTMANDPLGRLDKFVVHLKRLLSIYRHNG